MKELVKVENYMFTEYYEGTCWNKKVVCILDDNCVRFVGFVNGKRTVRREYSNKNKEMCMRKATEWLNN